MNLYFLVFNLELRLLFLQTFVCSLCRAVSFILHTGLVSYLMAFVLGLVLILGIGLTKYGSDLVCEFVKEIMFMSLSFCIQKV